jgi:hypothetical protein
VLLPRDTHPLELFCFHLWSIYGLSIAIRTVFSDNSAKPEIFAVFLFKIKNERRRYLSCLQEVCSLYETTAPKFVSITTSAAPAVLTETDLLFCAGGTNLSHCTSPSPRSSVHRRGQFETRAVEVVSKIMWPLLSVSLKHIPPKFDGRSLTRIIWVDSTHWKPFA